MKSGNDDTGAPTEYLEVTPVGTGVEIRVGAPSGELSLICTPERARELATALGLAADEAESVASADPVTVRADDLRRGDVRDGDRAMTVDAVRIDGATAHVTWKSAAGRSWNQLYDADALITLRRRGRQPGA
ncbi:hypothetical protein [Streptomyces sp. NBC_01022]|uniref:hypothetical protein n=1 Tax=Streptomyces sp. NBC_01022 TaxID=2903723 RepID=UPI002DD931E9|nr:hypothetical protein [Streptomyces sp. NBC_01022]WRZ80097.1 hypothetical protein OG316_07415 [Streptomyces sp. NBC_01022]